MPLSLAKLVANRAKAVVDFGDGDVLNVDYYPAKITGKMLANFAGAGDMPNLAPARALEVTMSVTDTLLALVASWDLAASTKKDGTPVLVPLDREHLDELGLPIQWAILAGIMSAGAAGAGEAKAPGA